MGHASGAKENMVTNLGIALLFHCPGLEAGEARYLANRFYGRGTVAEMRAMVKAAGGFKGAAKVAFERYEKELERLWR